MLGLFGTLNLGQRSLQTQRQGVEVAGHNLANINNPAYTRQRVSIQTSLALTTPFGSQGTGAEITAIRRLRDQFIDQQLQSQISQSGYLDARRQALDFAQANLGQKIDTQAAGPDGEITPQGLGQGLLDDITDLFSAFQNLSNNPALPETRQTLLNKAANLASQFNQLDQRLHNLQSVLNDSVQTDLSKANQLLTDIAQLNGQIVRNELTSRGLANDLRDLRQQKLEDLAKLINLQANDDGTGALTLTSGPIPLVAKDQILDSLETFDPGAGQLQIRTRSSQTPLNLRSGSIQGTIEARDGPVATLQNELNQLAAVLITQVNYTHRPGFSLNDTSGADFFSGSSAANIQVNPNLINNPDLIQTSGTPGTHGNNQIALALAQLQNKPQTALANQTFTQAYSKTVTTLGNAVATVKSALEDQNVVQSMLRQQRDSTSGVSIDDEMTDLIRFQKAFEASARLITTIDEMLDTIVNLKR